MKIDVIALTINVVAVFAYQNITKSNITIFKKFIIVVDITVYNKTFVI